MAKVWSCLKMAIEDNSTRNLCTSSTFQMSIPGIKDPAVPLGSLVIVSGVTGFIGSHVADQVLAAGYKVRGTTRNTRKGAWVEDYFKNKYGSDNFELSEVLDMAAQNAFDQVITG